MATRRIGMGLVMGLEEKLPSGFLLTTVEKLGANREKIIREVEAAALAAKPTHQLKGLLA